MKRAILVMGVFAGASAIVAVSYGFKHAHAVTQTVALRGQTPPSEGATDPAAGSAAAGAASGEGAKANSEGGKALVSRRPRAPEATVYVDGKPVAILRAVELPPGLTTTPVKTKWGSDPTYLISDYLAAIHVDAKKVKALHFYGGSRVVMVDGEDFRKNGQELGFTFTMQDRGKVNMHFPGTVHTNTTIDLMTNLAIYIEKEPPTMHRDGWGDYPALADGKPIDGMPYAAAEQLKGTRVYVDGILVGIVKRKLLANDLLVGEVGTSTSFSLRRYLESVGVKIANKTPGSPANQVKAVDLLSDDDLVERLDAPTWLREVDSLTFSLPTHSRGHIVMARPRLDDGKARISSVQLFIKNEPPKRWLAPPEVVALAEDPQQQAQGRRADDSESL